MDNRRIPWLRYLFSVERKEILETEIVILLRPRLVREVEIAESSLKAIPVGLGFEADIPVALPAPQLQGSQPQQR